MTSTPELAALSREIRGLMEAVPQLEQDVPRRDQLDRIIARGALRPAEDEAIGFWFARFLTIRDHLWTVIDDVRALLGRPARDIQSRDELRYFLVGYAAVCLLIRIDRVLLSEVADDSLMQRKLNESFPEFRIPRKQFTAIFSGYVDQANILGIRQAMQVARWNRRRLLRLADDPEVGFIVARLPELEASLNPSKLGHVKRALAYLSHKWRRRGMVSVERVLSTALEGFGRAASEFCDMENKRVSPAVIAAASEFLQPGDVIVTRHAKALTNLFFPGFWPHVALYVGTPQQRDAAGIRIDEDRRKRWTANKAVLEAKKDGVLLRPLADTMRVDAFAVLRPRLEPASVTRAVERALSHEGKQYNFDFNFFTSDRVVCTEVVYRAFDGLDDLRFPLTERAGRKTLSAEDLLDFVLESGAFTPVAIYGAPGSEDELLCGPTVREVLAASYGASEAARADGLR